MKLSAQKVFQTGLASVASFHLASSVTHAINVGGSINPGTGFATNMASVINGVLSFVMVIAALLVFFYLIWGGIEWITSGGDKGKTESARNKITAAVIGLVILAASYAILLVVLNFLGFGNLDDVFSGVQTL